MKKFFALCLMLSLVTMANAQYQLTVLSVEDISSTDLRARRANFPTDNNGEQGALVRVQVPLIKNVDFGKNGILGTPESTSGEYLVYVAQGTKKLTLKHANFLPLDIVFAEHGIRIESKGAYLIKLQLPAQYKENNRQIPTSQYLEFVGVPKDALIMVNGEAWDARNPRKKVSFGTYEYKITCQGYVPDSGKVVVEDYNRAVRHEVNMRSTWGRLVFLSVDAKDYSGAVIYVDGQPQGELPKPDGIMLEPGVHEVMIAKRMHDPFRETVVIEAGEDYMLNMSMDVKFSLVTLIVDGDINAEIYIDDEQVGKGRINNRPIEWNEYYIYTSRENCNPVGVNVKIDRDTTIYLAAPEPILGTIEATANVVGAKVSIDWKETEHVTPCIISDVPIGRHLIIFEYPGATPYSQEVVVSETEVATVHARLAREQTLVFHMNVDTALVTINGKTFTMHNNEFPWPTKVDSVYYIQIQSNGYYDWHDTIMVTDKMLSYNPELLALPTAKEKRKNEYYHQVGEIRINWLAANLEAGTTFGVDASLMNMRFKAFELQLFQLGFITPLYMKGMDARPGLAGRPGISMNIKDWMFCYEPEIRLHMVANQQHKYFDWYFGLGGIIPLGYFSSSLEGRDMFGNEIPMVHDADAIRHIWFLVDFGFQKTGKVGAFNMFLRYDGGVALCMGFALGTGFKKQELKYIE